MTDTAVHGATGARIAEALRHRILSGEYEPGARIRQDELADAHGASRLPVREALRLLEAEGLVTVVANTGAWVARLGLAECDELYRIRERLEPLLLRYNVALLAPATLDRLDALADLMERTDDVEEFLRHDREFHLSCYGVAPTTLLDDTVQRLWNRTQHYRRAYLRVAAPGDHSVHHEHHLLVTALRRQDADEAERVLTGHIRRTRLELARHPEVFSH